MARGRKKATPEELFEEWWAKAEKKVSKIQSKWIKKNAPNDPDDEPGGDDWHVNQMMHDGEAHYMTYEIAERVFLMGYRGENWSPNMSDSLFCSLNEIIEAAYLAGKEMVS